MIREYFKYKTTITSILAEEQSHIDAAKEAMVAARQDVEKAIAEEPLFGATLTPMDDILLKSDIFESSVTLKRMIAASERAFTGPMAAVAGTIAWAGVEAMRDAGAKYAVIDNGGDIAYIADRPVRIGLFAGGSEISSKYAFVLPPGADIYGVCTSSATVGPSISFGVFDSVTVFSPDVSLADAWATAACNEFLPVADPNAEENNAKLLDRFGKGGADGIFAVCGSTVIRSGIIPEIVPAAVDEKLITFA